MVYLCKMHNIVNEMLGKPKFDCNPTNIEQRWGGDCGCDLNSHDDAAGDTSTPNNANNAPKEN
jgi:Mitochondrial sulfhydryl oxidase involved in the biogenesis of cytosolic Fe/S proteins